jgi:hypothetical protein
MPRLGPVWSRRADGAERVLRFAGHHIVECPKHTAHGSEGNAIAGGGDVGVPRRQFLRTRFDFAFDLRDILAVVNGGPARRSPRLLPEQPVGDLLRHPARVGILVVRQYDDRRALLGESHECIPLAILRPVRGLTH